MNTKPRTVASLALVALAALVTLGIFRDERRAHAQDVQPPMIDRISFGMVGITQGQTARINVANVLTANDPSYPPGPTRVVLIFLNSDGQLFRNRDGSPIRRVAMLERGQATFLDLNFDEFPPGPTRIHLRAVVTALPPGSTDNALPPGPIVPTVEVITNANGRTVFALSGAPAVRQVPPPQPD
ncbi:MAG TPA: hypothetical protein VNO24_09110 [Blastocatellia bacterium]|nr:hypothetical protein [Blastocatellia bacterium]